MTNKEQKIWNAVDSCSVVADKHIGVKFSGQYYYIPKFRTIWKEHIKQLYYDNLIANGFSKEAATYLIEHPQSKHFFIQQCPELEQYFNSIENKYV